MDVLGYKEKSHTAFNKQAQVFDGTMYSKFSREAYPIAIEALRKIPFGSILDLGCGTGMALKLILDKRPDVKAYGLDLSENMLKVAENRLGPKAVLTKGDAENMPYKGGSFDTVLCIESFHHYPEPLKALSEIMRVLKPGGTFVLCDSTMKSPARQIVNFFFRFSRDGDVKIYSESELRSMLGQTGFKKIEWRKTSKHIFLCTAKKL